MASMQGRVAAITGAGKGLGKAYAKWLARQGCAVVVNNRTHPGQPSSARQVVDEIVADGGLAIAYEGSIEDEATGKALIEAAIDTYGKLDILICNAGVMPVGSFAEADLGELRRVIDINYWGTAFPLQAAWKHMLERGYGRIVISGSTVGVFGYAQTATYGASRAATLGLARSLALETPHGKDIKINVIMPEAYTNMSAEEFDKNLDEAGKAALSVDLVAPVVGWLSSKECPFNGAAFHTGGGRVARVAIVQTPGAAVDSLDGRSTFNMAKAFEPADSLEAFTGLLGG